MSDPTPPDAGSPPSVDPRRHAARLDFEMGLSLRVIGAKLGISRQTVNNWAREEGWSKGEAKPIPPAKTKPDEPTPVVVEAMKIEPPRLEPRVEAVPRSEAPRAEATNVVALRVGSVPAHVDIGLHVNQDGDAVVNIDTGSAQGVNPVAEEVVAPQGDLATRFRARVRELLERPTPDEAADVAARAVVQTVMRHRSGVQRAQSLVDRLMGQLDMATDMRELLEDAISQSGEPRKVQLALMRLVSLAGHAGTIKDLATAQTKLVALERQTFGLGVTDDPTPETEVAEVVEAKADQFDEIRERVRLRLAGGKT